MRYKYFFIRTMNLLLVLALLAGYQIAIHTKNQEAKISKLESQVASMKKDRSDLEKQLGITDEKNGKDSKANWKDGTYKGSGDGFGGKIQVEVTVKKNKIDQIKILRANGEDSAYLHKAENILETMKKQQTLDVDTVSGATFSSTGIKNAVQNAMERAVQ